MPLIAIKNKYQVVIPKELRRQMSLHVGDLLEAKVERGKITLTPKSVVDRAIAEALEDVRKGRIYGPFESADQLLASLKRRRKAARASGRR